MKLILSLAFSLFFLTTQVFAGQPDKELHEKCIYPTVHITGKNHHGTGVIIKSTNRGTDYENYVFTVAHIIKKDKDEYEPHEIGVAKYENWSKLTGVTTYPMDKVLHRDDIADMALISFISLEPVPVAEIDYKPELYIGNDVLRVGCGQIELFRVDYGKITAVKGSSAAADVAGLIRISAPTVLGDSGGPVFHENKLIGIAECIKATRGHFSSTLIYHIAFAVPVERYLECPEIKKYLN